MKLNVTIPIKTISEANRREHWAAKARRVKKHRTAARGHVRSLPGLLPLLAKETSLSVTLTRIAGPRGKVLDSDNLSSSMKATRDGVADALRIDDGSERVTWNYAQARGKEYAVEIIIAPASA